MRFMLTIIGVIAALAIIGSIFWYFLYGEQMPAPITTLPPAGYMAYESDGIHFEYPNTYALTERAETFEGNPMSVVVLIDKNVVVPDMSEGPPSISLIIVRNTDNLPLDQWIKEKSISNFALSDKQLASSTIEGEQAISYTHSGLYESAAVATKHGNSIYLFSVGSINPSDPIYEDFQELLNTVHFK